MTNIQNLIKGGQSIWLDSISRQIIESGDLKQLIDHGVTGITSNPSIFEKAIGSSDSYDKKIVKLSKSSSNSKEIFEQIATDDIRKAAEILMPIHQKSNSNDGFVSLEVDPYLANNYKKTIDEALKNQGISIWDKERPSVLVWLVSQKNNNRSFVNIEENFEYLNILEDRASARGISLLFPLLDLQDDSKISVTDVWGGFSEPIVEASKRYQANVILTGKFTQILPTLWESEWAVYYDEQVVDYVSQSDVADIVLEEGIDELVDQLVSHYSDDGRQDIQVIELLVNDIENIDEYAQIFSYLTSLQSVNQVNVKEVTSRHVVFELTSERGVAGVHQAISLGKILESIEGSSELEYRLLP